jgi:hypothetical protein
MTILFYYFLVFDYIGFTITGYKYLYRKYEEEEPGENTKPYCL